MTPSVGERIEHRRLDEVHFCVVVGCTHRASYAFMASEDGLLAGYTWCVGDMVDLCPSHAHMVYRGVDPLWGQHADPST